MRLRAAAVYFKLPEERWPIIAYAHFHPDGQEEQAWMEKNGEFVEGVLNIPAGTNKIEL
ncbi:MAG: hypothetical protein JO281_18635 [Pseudonocardiales bacterium]|nr:hypothetical protein [Pseudonocardiales bacterium]